MNRANHEKGYSRDIRVLDHLGRCSCLNTDQIHLLEFSGLSIEMVHRCTRRLVRKKRIKRGDRISFSEKDFFWLVDKKKPRNIEHTIGKSWIYTFMTIRARASKFPLTFQNEPKEFLPVVQPDQFITFKAIGELKPYFCEFNRHESGNEFKKIPQYNALAGKLIKEKGGGATSHWWIDLNREQNFTILIVTTGPKSSIEEIIKKEKSRPYLIELLTLDEIKKFCFNLHSAKKEELTCSQVSAQPPQSLPFSGLQLVSKS